MAGRQGWALAARAAVWQARRVGAARQRLPVPVQCASACGPRPRLFSTTPLAGKLPDVLTVGLPDGIKFAAEPAVLKVLGPKGETEVPVHPGILVEIGEREVAILRNDKAELSRRDAARAHKLLRGLQGLTRGLVENALVGVTRGHTKTLIIDGVGFRAEDQPDGRIQFTLGYAHPIFLAPPPEVTVTCATRTKLVISGCDKQLVGEVAAKIRDFRVPNRYNGKGIRYEDEVIKLTKRKT